MGEYIFAIEDTFLFWAKKFNESIKMDIFSPLCEGSLYSDIGQEAFLLLSDKKIVGKKIELKKLPNYLFNQNLRKLTEKNRSNLRVSAEELHLVSFCYFDENIDEIPPPAMTTPIDVIIYPKEKKIRIIRSGCIFFNIGDYEFITNRSNIIDKKQISNPILSMQTSKKRCHLNALCSHEIGHLFYLDDNYRDNFEKTIMGEIEQGKLYDSYSPRDVDVKAICKKNNIK